MTSDKSTRVHMAMIDYQVEHGAPAPINRLVELTGLSHTTVFYHLRRLAEEGLVDYCPEYGDVRMMRSYAAIPSPEVTPFPACVERARVERGRFVWEFA